jgi:rRNA processing protein Krr1/Pno1
MNQQEVNLSHKEHLCENYKPIIGQKIHINGKPLRNPINNANIHACIKSEDHKKTYNNCNLCKKFKEKEN